MEGSAVVEVTAGWYGIRALLDRALTRLLHDRKIVVGQKLIVYGAELVGSEQAVSPLEVHVCIHEYASTERQGSNN
ncbi:Breast cancer 2, early onset [Desmophyllum pertusum]|uniref:Breast cancer 2, early onset n=1 Tax=Desmophyllum pertusum TaxID=174260 RepID=A0A9W9Y6U8_9CNID|nr:Breast cancer 2, early onset [Desmophyllum pertusum]